MCGRFSLTQSAEIIAQTFELPEVSPNSPRYNIAPTQQVATIRQNSQRQFQWMRWGLIPSWAKDLSIGNRLINARAETLAEKPSFRNAYKQRRCLIIADGFYEWQKVENRKQPYYFQMKDGKPFAFAGLWETWQSPQGEEIISCTIVTTDANAIAEPIHPRMPVILPPDSYAQWLDSSVTDSKILQGLLQPYDSEAMKTTAVSSTVNNPANDTLECIQSRDR
jgi:putative SOS response-associated peptidase YedK